jgi:hypothetical protein
VVRAVLAAALLVTIGAPAHADALADARAAIDAVRYDEARALLDRALAEGGNSPAATAEIHRLLATTLVVLGDPPAAQTHYRRWLAIDPQGALPTTAAAKLREPFLAAQAYVREHGPLAAAIAARRATAVEVDLATNPDGLAAYAAPAGATRAAWVPITAARVEVPITDEHATIALLDEHGNQLALLSLAPEPPGDPAAATTAAAAADPSSPAPRTDTAAPAAPLYRRWQLWAVPAGLFLAGGGYFTYAALQAQDDLEAIADTRGEHFLADYEAALDRRDRSRTLAALLLGAGAACAITSVVMIATRQDRRVDVTVDLAPTSAGVWVRGAF